MRPRPTIRLFDPDGGSNLQASGLETGGFHDVYHFLLTAPWPRLVALLVGAYLGAHVFFAAGLWPKQGSLENARPGSFADAFFFSVQTMATIGYGKFAPHTLLANVLVTLEAFVGLLGLALMTGLIFAKFSRPSARVLFSHV